MDRAERLRFCLHHALAIGDWDLLSPSPNRSSILKFYEEAWRLSPEEAILMVYRNWWGRLKRAEENDEPIHLDYVPTLEEWLEMIKK